MQPDDNMQERNVLSGATSAFLAPLLSEWSNLSIWLGFAALLIVMDLRYGIKAARKRGEKIRGSRAVRRTINKLVDYICWIIFAWFLGHTFGSSFNIPIIAIVALAIIYAIEITSIIDNYFAYKGINKRVNLGKVLGAILRKNKIDDVLEDKQ